MAEKYNYGEWIPTIGVECHVQLATKTKLFSGAKNDSRGAKPNTTVSPICFGLPGVLPLLNKKAVELAVRAGIALNAEIQKVSSFDRKHYFYPDLPKGYQTTQMEMPIIKNGFVDVPGMEDGFRVEINQAHLEEDAGKLIHPKGADYSLVDLNRAGTPLIEIVSGPNMHGPLQAKRFAQELYLLMTHTEVTNGNLYHGNVRFDVNVSVAKKGSEKLGIRTETKNLNSFRSVEKAADFEIKRQIKLLKDGEKPVAETRGWDEDKQKTHSQRRKEEIDDYRYFPDADIPPIVLDKDYIEEIRNEISPLLPPNLREKLRARNIPENDIGTLFMYPLLLDRTMQIIGEVDDKELRHVVSLLINVLPAEFDGVSSDEYGKNSFALPEPLALRELAQMVINSEISSSNAKVLLKKNWKNLKNPKQEAQTQNMLQVSDEGEIEAIIKEVLNDPASQKSIEDIKAGKEKAIGFLVGQVMKKSQGKANPGMAQKLIRSRLQ